MANTPAGPKVTGAVGTFPFVGAGRSAAFLGFGREAPRIKTRLGWVPFFTDVGGPLISFDDLFVGEEALVSVTLNYYRSDTLALVESVVPGAGMGVQPFGAVGALALFEGLTYPLALTFPFAAKAVYKAAGMPAGVKFLAARLEGNVEYAPGTGHALEISLIWKCKSVWNLDGSSALATRDLSGLPAAI